MIGNCPQVFNHYWDKMGELNLYNGTAEVATDGNTEAAVSDEPELDGIL
jgi:hypothetical protein